MVWIALAGFTIGLVVTAPPTGPVALLVVRRALQGELLRGLWLGLGTSVADVPYVALGAWGYGYVLERNPDVAAGFDVFGALVLFALAVQLARIVDDDPPQPSNGSGYPWGDLGLGFVLGLLNPTRLVTWTIAASLVSRTMADTGGPGLATWVLAVTVGEIAWYAVFLASWRRWGRWVSGSARRWVLRGTAALALGLAGWLLVRAVRVLVA